MKRKDILKKLAERGGAHFRKVEATPRRMYCNGIFKSAIGRHTEIPEKVVRQIEKQTGVALH